MRNELFNMDEALSQTNHGYFSFEELESNERNLIAEAKKASSASYSPYSNFKVGAALVLEDGTIIHGSNQENASYPAGLCAERVAFFHAGAVYPNVKITMVAVIAQRADEENFRGVAPCGSCRQVMLEYEIKQNSPIKVIMQSLDSRWIRIETTKVLLPFCFDKHNL